MYRRIIVPTEKEHTIELPAELFGVQVEVLAFALQEDQKTESKIHTDPDFFYDNIKLDFSGYKFNRDEANER